MCYVLFCFKHPQQSNTGVLDGIPDYNYYLYLKKKKSKMAMPCKDIIIVYTVL